MKKLYRILPLIFIAFLLSCGEKVFMKIEEIPVPPEARQAAIEGAYEVTLDSATNTILSNLKKDYGQTQEKILFLPPDAEPSKIFAFYEPKLSEKEFRKDGNVPPSGRNYQLTVWRGAGGQAIAVAVIEAGKDADGKTNKFLALYLAEK
jgi:hypothetical protein